MATCRECRMTSQHKLGCSRRRYSGSTVTASDESVSFIEYGTSYSDYGTDSGGGCDSSSSGGCE